MLGHQGDRVIGSHVSELVQNERLNEMIDQALAMPVEEFAELTDEFQFEDRAGNPETILGARCVPFRDRLNRNLGTVTLLQDITTLKKMEQIKSDFVSMVAHEIRSPMNSVLMLIKVILKGRAGHVTEKQEEMLDRVSEKIKSLVNLASELLDLAKIESGLIMQEQERFNIGEILTEQVAFHQTKAQEKDILLELIPISEPAFVLGNHYNMEEVISNLVGNAIKYTPAGGKIWVSTTAKENHHCICVRDTGIGMSREDIERIFERFYRVKNEKTRNIGGTGLGLAIVKSIVEAHNGIINVESEPDRGSAFKVYIPTAIHSD
jgi:signal transduction histidine kinase